MNRYIMDSGPSTESPVKSVESEGSPKPASFKLWFPVRGEIGRSNRNHIGPVAVVAPKFYSQERSRSIFGIGDLKKQIERKLTVAGPREKYELPNTESQRYGWYSTPLYMSDYNFKKNTNQLIKEHLMNYEKIRE